MGHVQGCEGHEKRNLEYLVQRGDREPLYSILNITKMAKSLRSKWKRKMKAEKRVRYGQKERDRLEKMLASYEAEEKERQEQKEKEVMEHEPQVLGAPEPEKTEEQQDKDAMDTSSSKQAPKHSSKSLKSQYGNPRSGCRTGKFRRRRT